MVLGWFVDVDFIEEINNCGRFVGKYMKCFVIFGVNWVGIRNFVVCKEIY